MSKQITFFDPRAIDPGYPNGREITVTANTTEEYAAHRAAILDPMRVITLIDPLELPEEPDPAWFTQEPTELDRLSAEIAILSSGLNILAGGKDNDLDL